MSKYVDKQIEVISSDNGIPRSFCWNGKWNHINRVLELWKDTGIWWEGESEKTFFRIESAGQSLYELYLDSLKQVWFLYRIYD